MRKEVRGKEVGDGPWETKLAADRIQTKEKSQAKAGSPQDREGSNKSCASLQNCVGCEKT